MGSPDTVLDGLAPSKSVELCVGNLIGPYRLLGKIGRGGMGEIWRAEDTRLGRTVALKLLSPAIAWNPLSKSRFLQEARAASALDHPNICSIYEVGETADHRLYLVMPCYEGELLLDRIARGPLPVSEALDLASQIAKGLGEAHRKKIVHRDVKPANLMITGDGTLKVLDFGIAKLAGGDGLTREGAVVGTLAYMSPEQIRGETVDERSDLWSLGVVIYEMLTGSHPFLGEQAEAVVLREAILHAGPKPIHRIRPEVPVELSRLAGALLEKDPAARPPNAESIMAVLCQWPGDVTREDLAWFGRSWGRLRLAIGLLALGLVLGSAIFLLRRENVAKATTGASRLSAAATPSPPVDQRKSVAVLGFRNLSGNPGERWLGPALTEMLTAELAAGGQFRVVSSDRTAEARQSLGLPDKENPDRESVERLHALVGADLAVTGTYLLDTSDHRRLRLDIRILSMPTGDTLASVVEVGSEPELFDLVARTGSKLRGALGFSLPTNEERSRSRGLLPLDSRAIRFYTEALSRLRAFDPAGARDLLIRAEAIEPSSVVIQSALSATWSMLGQDDRARAAALRAFGGRQTLPEESRLLVEARFYETGKQWDQASDTYRTLQTLFPDELEYGLRLANTLSMAGRSPEAMAILSGMRERPSPDGDDPRIDDAEAFVAWRLGDVQRMNDAASAAIAKGRRLRAWLIIARGLIYRSYFLSVKGQPHEAVAALREAEDLALRSGDRWTVGRIDSNLGEILLQQGDFDEAEQVQQRALATAKEFGNLMSVSVQKLTIGILRKERGSLPEARSLTEEALAGFRQIDYRAWILRTESELGSIYLSEGDPEDAQHLLAEALTLSRSIRRPDIEVQSLLLLVGLKEREGELEEALHLQEEALLLLPRLHNPRVAAEALEQSARLSVRAGNVALARYRFGQAQRMVERAGHRLTSDYFLGMKAGFAFQEGDLATCQRMSQEQLRHGRELRDFPLETVALRGLAQVANAAGELNEAQTLLQEALRLSEASGYKLTWMDASLELARLELETGSIESALRRSRTASEWNHARSFLVEESRALALAAEALLRLGRDAEARDAAARARALVPEMDRELQLEIAPALARVEARGGNPDGALRDVGRAAAEAGQLGFVPLAFEIQLAQGEIRLGRGEIAAARTELDKLQKDAGARGFQGIARRAAGLLAKR